MSGYCSFTASGRPSCAVARCTCPREAAAAAFISKPANFSCQSAPSSAAMRRRTKAGPMGGAFVCSLMSSAAYSGGSASGTVASICATLMSGPFNRPSASRRMIASRARASSPARRAAPMRTAAPDSAAPTRA